jgi:prophage antirepressor-like protein
MDELTFAFDQSTVRFVDGLPVANDVAKALGYSNYRKAIGSLPDKYKCASPVRGQTTVLLTEPGIYYLIFKSTLKTAEQFREWVFEEVLPGIRRDGGYIDKNATDEQLARLQSQIDWQQGRLLRASREAEDADRRANRYLQLLYDNGIDPDAPVDEPEFWYQDEDIDYEEDTNDEHDCPF